MREHGFDPEFDEQVEAQVESANGPAPTDGLRDLTGLLWSSIDNTESRDLDQLEVAEELPNGAIRILVAPGINDTVSDKHSFAAVGETKAAPSSSSPSQRIVR